jgi:hypothetical protein
MHWSADRESWIQQLIAQMPDLPRPYPFDITPTGYVQMTTPVPVGTTGKAIDQLGRHVFLIDQHFLFQRYSNGNIYMHAPIWFIGQGQPNTCYNCVENDLWTNLINN